MRANPSDGAALPRRPNAPRHCEDPGPHPEDEAIQQYGTRVASLSLAMTIAVSTGPIPLQIPLRLRYSRPFLGTGTTVTLYARFAAHIDAILDALEAEGQLASGIERAGVAVEPPRDSGAWRSRHQCGDGARQARRHQSARAGRADRAEAAASSTRSKAPRSPGPGFINIRLDPRLWREELRDDPRRGRRIMAAPSVGGGERVNVEYVSANPTGPMHMGHCRGAVVGDALASLLEHAGYAVTREYYVNDAGGAGRRARPLRASALSRGARREIGEIPEGLYPGDYLKPVGEALAARIWRHAMPMRPEKRMAGAVPPADGRGDDRPDPGRSRLARRPSRSLRLGSRGPGDRRRRPRACDCCGEKGLVYRGHARAAQGQDRRGLGAGRADSCSARPPSATTRTGRSRSRTAAGPISAPTPPIICRSSRPRTS